MIKHLRAKWIFVIFAVILAFCLLADDKSGQDSTAFLRGYGENLSNFSDESVFDLAEVTPWDWEQAYLLSPGLTRAEVEPALGVTLPDLFDFGAGGMVFTDEDGLVFCMAYSSEDCSFSADLSPLIALAGEGGGCLQISVEETGILFSKTTLENGWPCLVLPQNAADHYLPLR